MIHRRQSALFSKAARPVIEFLEQRQLLSATLSVSSSLLVFNAVKNSSASQTETLTLTDTGDAPLTLGVGSATLAADPTTAPAQDQARFTIVNGTSIPATLQPGASFGLQLYYKATSVTTDEAILDIASNDPVNPTVQVNLHGIGTKGLGGSNQPSLATILQAYNIPTYVGDGPDDANALQDNTYPYPPDPTSQEVVLQRFVKAGAGPVTINVLASFTASGTHPYTLGTYTPGDPTSLNQLFTTPTSEYQSVYVQPQGTTTFDPGSSSFGFYCVSNTQVSGRLIYSEDALNTFDSTTGRHFRFFPMENPDGTIVPNQYIMTSTEWNAPVGYDFTNIVAIVSNIKAAPGAPDGPVMGLQNLNALPGSKTMAFNLIRSPNTVVGDIVHNTGVLQVNNTGDEQLVLTSYTITSGYALKNAPTFPVTIAAGANLDLTVELTERTQPNVPYNETNSPAYPNGGGVWDGTLTLTSNDPETPSASVPLAGWVQYHSENSNEPSFQTITNLLFGWSTEINPTPISELTESDSTDGSSPTYYGQEVVSGFWQEADPSLKVNVQQLAAFHTEGNNSSLYWYLQGSTNYNKLFTTQTDVGQTLFPLQVNETTPAAGSFSNSGIFGFRVDTSEYSNDAQNTSSATGGGHHFRFYPVISANGTLIPNDYIMTMDYSNTTGSPQNFDFQDNVYLVTNIRPAVAVTGIAAPQTTGGGPPVPTDFNATNTSAGVLLQWAPVTYTNLAGYDVYSATSLAGPYTLLTSSAPTTGTTYTDTTFSTTGSTYYRVAAVDSTTQDQSLGATAAVTISSSGGGGGGTPTGNPVVSPESATTQAVTPVTINVLQDATDTGGALNPATVNVSTLPTSGTTSINTSNGAITYTPNPGFSGTDTFQYTVSDSTGAVSDPATVTITVTAAPVGDPVASNLSFSANEDAALTITTIPSSAFDNSSATIDPTTVTITQQPAHGTAVADPTTGNVIYTPATNYSGTDSFLYTIGDTLQAVSQPATVSITIVKTTVPPIAVDITPPPVSNSGSTTIDVIDQATAGSSPLSPASVTVSTAPSHGSAVVNTSTGSIVYTPSAGFVGTDSLRYTVADTDGMTSAPATVTLDVGVAINTTTARTISFTDTGGSLVSVTLTGVGTGEVLFTGSGTSKAVAGRRGTGSVTVTGTGLSLSSIELTGTTAASALAISRRGASVTALGGLTVTGSIGRVIAPTTGFTGTMNVSGSLTALQLLSVSSATINLGSTLGSGPALTLSAGQVVNTSLQSTLAVKLLKVINWTDTAGTDSIDASGITSLAVTGNFQANLSTGVLGTTRIGGQVAADAWNVSAASGSAIVGSIASGWTGNFTGAVGSLAIRSGGFAGTLTAGSIGTLSIIGNDTGSITAGSIRSARIVGSFSGGSLTLTRAGVVSLGRLAVTGSTNDSIISSAGSIGAVTTAGINGSSIDAGVTSSVTLPASASDFSSSASLGSFINTGRSATFANTDIGATTITSLSLGRVITSSNSVPFGIGAGSIRSLSATLDTGGVLRLKAAQLLSSSTLASYVSAHSLTLNSFVIRPGL